MKQIRIVIFALYAAVFVACNNEKDDVQQSSNNREIVIDANVGQMTEKKSLKLGSCFDTGDEISVYAWTGSASEIPTELQVNNSINTLGADGKWTAEPKMLWKDARTKHYFLGVYPHKDLNDFVADEYTLNTEDQEESDILVATNLQGLEYRSTTIPLKFSHVMARLDVNVKVANFSADPTEAQIKIKAKTNATINYLTKNVTASGESSEIILPLVENTVDGYLFSYSSIMVPQNGLEELDIVLGDQTFTYTRSEKISLKSGCYTTLNLTLRRHEISVGDVSIVNWNTGETIEDDAVVKEPDALSCGGTIGDAVDLGLTSGTLWANHNIGASAPEEAGNYYAWGETETKSEYNYSTYKYMDHTIDYWTGYTKYTYADGQTNCVWYQNGEFVGDGKTELDDDDDVAVQTWGGTWKIPTAEQIKELLRECYTVWTNTYNGKSVCGYIVYKAKSSEDKGWEIFSGNAPSTNYSVANDVHIFLPAAGDRWDSNINNVGSLGCYWSKNTLSHSPQGLVLLPDHVSCANYCKRDYGASIRPVCLSE